MQEEIEQLKRQLKEIDAALDSRPMFEQYTNRYDKIDAMCREIGRLQVENSRLKSSKIKRIRQ